MCWHQPKENVIKLVPCLKNRKHMKCLGIRTSSLLLSAKTQTWGGSHFPQPSRFQWILPLNLTSLEMLQFNTALYRFRLYSSVTDLVLKLRQWDRKMKSLVLVRMSAARRDCKWKSPKLQRLCNIGSHGQELCDWEKDVAFWGTAIMNFLLLFLHFFSPFPLHRIHLKGYSGTAGKISSIGQPGNDFTTKDADNDKCVCKCSQLTTGGKKRAL